jgi:hypothetical protein
MTCIFFLCACVSWPRSPLPSGFSDHRRGRRVVGRNYNCHWTSTSWHGPLEVGGTGPRDKLRMKARNYVMIGPTELNVFVVNSKKLQWNTKIRRETYVRVGLPGTCCYVVSSQFLVPVSTYIPNIDHMWKLRDGIKNGWLVSGQTPD